MNTAKHRYTVTINGKAIRVLAIGPEKAIRQATRRIYGESARADTIQGMPDNLRQIVTPHPTQINVMVGRGRQTFHASRGW